jgi:DNA-binding transcriptional MocR family regulator
LADLVDDWEVARYVQLMHGWWEQEGSLHERLASKLRLLIRGGDLPSLTRLPSERLMAAGLSLSRNTVNLAFEELRSEGVLTSRQGAGTFVSIAGRHRIARGDWRLDSLFTIAASAVEAEPGIDLRSAALPALDLVKEELSNDVGLSLLRQLPNHGYIPGGLPELRQAVAKYYSGIGLPTQADEILITSGAMQALRIVAAGLLEPKDKVLIEEPTFRGAIEVLRAVDARLVAAPSGPQGVDVGALARLLQRERPSMVVLMASGHNPTGAILDESTRRLIAKMFLQSGAVLVEDGSVSDATIDGDVPAPLAAFGCSAVTIGSASKSFWGGLRVGWIRAEPGLIKQLALLKGAQDLGTSLITQELTVRLLLRIDEARSKRKATLARARGVLLEALHTHLPDWTVSLPRGGASAWVTLPEASAGPVCALAARNGVYVMPGSTFSCTNGLERNIRVAFAQSDDLISQGVERLGRAWRQHKHHAASPRDP